MVDVQRLLSRWVEAGLIDVATATRIQAFESGQLRPARWGWAARIALGSGALVLVAGVLLFVAAQWDGLSPSGRFALALGAVAAAHGAAVFAAGRPGQVSTILHGIGTALFGGAIFLTGQIFNLEAHWPSGVMLWAFGAITGWWLLRDVLHLAFTALLVPAWLASEWIVVGDISGDEYHVAIVLGSGLLMLALAYHSADAPARTLQRRVLAALGSVLLFPAALVLVIGTANSFAGHRGGLPTVFLVLGWIVAVGGPLCLAAFISGAKAWPLGVAAAWAIVLLWLPRASVWPHLWWAIGATALALWGVREADRRRINLGFVLFALTVMVFYFSRVMTALAQSASLIGLGVVLLAGGWALERARRRVVSALVATKEPRP